MIERRQIGDYVAVGAPNSEEDRVSGRLAHVLGPTLTDGRRATVASCRNLPEAIAFAEKADKDRRARAEKLGWIREVENDANDVEEFGR